MPSQLILDQKKTLVDELAQKLNKAVSGVLVDYKGINVSDDTALRKNLREANVEYLVVKNTLLKLAAQKAGISGLEDVLSGTTAIAISYDDILIAPNLLFKQVEKSKGAFKIKKGFVGKDAIDAATVEQYAKLPSKEIMLGQLLFTLNAPIQKLAIALSKISEQKETA